jgi:hypothetical protein
LIISFEDIGNILKVKCQDDLYKERKIMKTLQLPEQLAQKVLDYLTLQPYKDVYILVAELMQLQTIEPLPPISYKNEDNKEA